MLTSSLSTGEGLKLTQMATSDVRLRSVKLTKQLNYKHRTTDIIQINGILFYQFICLLATLILKPYVINYFPVLFNRGRLGGNC